MMRRTIVLLTLALAGCNQAAETKRSDNENFKVDRLFTVDGCNVYRFRDAVTPVYFSSCAGGTQWQERHGKSTVDVEVPTAR
jgi:hypothetical protein